jgi:hypothetical protein
MELKNIGIAALALLASVSSACGSSENRLLGTWKLASDGHCSLDRIVFTEANIDNRDGSNSYYAGHENTVPVTYLVDGPDRITVTTRDRATSVTYVFSDENHMAMGDNPGCAFERVS